MRDETEEDGADGGGTCFGGCEGFWLGGEGEGCAGGDYVCFYGVGSYAEKLEEGGCEFGDEDEEYGEDEHDVFVG